MEKTEINTWIQYCVLTVTRRFSSNTKEEFLIREDFLEEMTLS